jgi:hypothetical protein
VIRIIGFLVYIHRTESEIIENTPFRKLNLIPSKGKGEKSPTALGSLQRFNLNDYMLAPSKGPNRAGVFSLPSEDGADPVTVPLGISSQPTSVASYS